MKKTIIAIAALTMTFGFTSCKKDYTCVCKLNGTIVKTTQYNDVNRAEAEDKCDGDATFGGVTYDCDVEL
jgi:hypothetical protein